jgi:hypothetical protein
MLNKWFFGIGIYCFSLMGMDTPVPLPLNISISPSLNFEVINEQLKSHIKACGASNDTMQIVTDFYRLCIDNPSFCDKHFYRDFVRLKMHQLQASAYVSCWLWEQEIKRKMRQYLMVEDNEILSLENVTTNRSIISSFCQRMKDLAQ